MWRQGRLNGGPAPRISVEGWLRVGAGPSPRGPGQQVDMVGSSWTLDF